MSKHLGLLAVTSVVVLGLSAFLPLSDADGKNLTRHSVVLDDNYSTDTTLNNSASALLGEIMPQLEVQPNFAYVEIVPTGILVATTAANDPAVQNILEQTATTIPITYVTRRNSYQSLVALTAQVANDATMWQTSGINLTAFGPQDSTNTVVVHIDPYTVAAAVQLTSYYGGLLTVSPELVVPHGDSNRKDDNAQWTGADAIAEAKYVCTDWFNVYDHTLGQHRMVTAGHCGAGSWFSAEAELGTVVPARVFFDPRSDSEITDGDSLANTNNHVWADPHSGWRVVVGVNEGPSVGTHVCNDGAVTLENCQVVINSLGQSACYDGECVSGLMGAATAGGSAAFRLGDSGGPVYSVPANLSANANGVTAIGMVVASQSTSSGYLEPVDEVLGEIADNVTVRTTSG